MIKTIVPQRTDTYAAFPTMALWDNKVWIYYRQGHRGEARTHGRRGVVRRIVFPQETFRQAFDQSGDSLFDLGEDREVFAQDNEMDAIISPLDGQFALATRTFDKDRVMRTFISLSPTPEFETRHEVVHPNIAWFAFYGKGLVVEEQLIFPAYGFLHSIPTQMRPLLMATRDGRQWEIFSYVPDMPEGAVFNESSLIQVDSSYHLFMRRDGEPFGIWHTRSHNLKDWEPPKALCDAAHAPMTLLSRGTVWMSYRHIEDQDKAATALMEPLGTQKRRVIEAYEGSIYDGGYSDLIEIEGKRFVCYYQGNPEGEPFIRCCRLED